MVRRGILLILFLIGFNFFEDFAHKKTDGFSLHRIRFHDNSKKYCNPKIDPHLFDQPFHYLDCGNQCFAFASEDGQYILKFFKYANPFIPHFFTQIPLLNQFKPFRPKRHEKNFQKQKQDFQGYQLAYDHFQEGAGLIVVQLRPCQQQIKVTISDKLHIRHTFDLNTTPFVLQKRAVPIYKQLLLWTPQEQKEGVLSLIQLLRKRIDLQLKDDDVTFYSNFGFIGKTAIQIDPGHFTQGTYSDPELELRTILEPLIHWCRKHCPNLIQEIENEIFSY